MNRVIVVEPGKAPVEREVDGFDGAKAIIGGYVEHVRAGKFDVLCDEDGLMKGLSANCTAGGRLIVGTFVVTKLTTKGLKSLSPGEVKGLLRDYARP